MVARGDIWLVTLDPTTGSEVRKTRPCVVISPNEMHDYIRTVIVAPMTSAGKPFPYRVPVVFESRRGLILLDQIRAVDKSRLIKRLGRAASKTLDATLASLQELFVP
jgi:mRNA interferase MazF